MRFMISCKHCDKEFFLGFGFVRHLFKEHGIEATKNDKKVVRKTRLKFCLLPFALVTIIIRALLLGICFPLHWLYETMTEYRL